MSAGCRPFILLRKSEDSACASCRLIRLRSRVRLSDWLSTSASTVAGMGATDQTEADLGNWGRLSRVMASPIVTACPNFRCTELHIRNASHSRQTGRVR